MYLGVNIFTVTIIISFHARYTELEVRVAFKSGAPISFRAIVEFSDDIGIAVCSVAIHATSDNCLLTTHAYVRNSMIELKQSSIDRRTPRVSGTSEIFTDDEDYNVDILKPVRENVRFCESFWNFIDTVINRHDVNQTDCYQLHQWNFYHFYAKLNTCFFFFFFF